MPIRIRQLTCRVRVRTGGGGPQLHRAGKPERPELHFSLPIAQERTETGPEPGLTATEERGPGGEDRAPTPAPRKADPRAVADRVYDLMTQEILLARQRTGRL